MLVYELSEVTRLQRRWFALWSCHVASLFGVFSIWSFVTAGSPALIGIAVGLYALVQLLRGIDEYIVLGARCRVMASEKTVAVKRGGKAARFIKRRDCVTVDMEKMTLIPWNRPPVPLWRRDDPARDEFRQTFLAPLAKAWWPESPPMPSPDTAPYLPPDPKNELRLQLMCLFPATPLVLIAVFVISGTLPVPVSVPLSLLLLAPLYVLFRWHGKIRKLARVATAAKAPAPPAPVSGGSP